MNYANGFIFILITLGSCTINSSRKNLFRIDEKGVTVHYFIQKGDSLIFESNFNSITKDKKYTFVSLGHLKMPQIGESIRFQKFVKEHHEKSKTLIVESNKTKGHMIIKNHNLQNQDGFGTIVLEIDLKAYDVKDTNKLLNVFKGTATFKQQGHSNIFYYADLERNSMYKSKHGIDTPGSIAN